MASNAARQWIEHPLSGRTVGAAAAFNYFVAATAAALIGLLFYATLDTRQPGISRTRTIEPVVARGNQLPSQNSKIALPSHPTEASHADAFEEVAAAPEAEQSLKRERAQALTQELTEELEAQLRAEAAKNAQLLEQERQKTAALAQGVASARQELTTSAEKLHQALDEERERRAALADLQQSLQREQENSRADAGSQGLASDDDGRGATAPRARRGTGACRSTRERACGNPPRDRDPGRAVAKGSR
ncbi:hypothetical protein ACFIOY_35545 [Bradyrhizobium sp. TZ2]